MNLACNSGVLFNKCGGTVSRVLVFDGHHLVVALACERHQVSAGVVRRVYRNVLRGAAMK